MVFRLLLHFRVNIAELIFEPTAGILGRAAWDEM